MDALVLPLMLVGHSTDLPLPAYGTEGSAGLDLLAAIDAPLTLNPRERCLIPTGIAIALPEGYEAQIRSRSGLSWKHGLTVLNSPGTIDADYRGEIKVIMMNHGDEPFIIERGYKIAQMIISRYSRVRLCARDELPPARTRSEAGFGSTGLATL